MPSFVDFPQIKENRKTLPKIVGSKSFGEAEISGFRPCRCRFQKVLDRCVLPPAFIWSVGAGRIFSLRDDSLSAVFSKCDDEGQKRFLRVHPFKQNVQYSPATGPPLGFSPVYPDRLGGAQAHSWRNIAIALTD